MADLTGNLATDEKTLREAVLSIARDLLSSAPYDFPATNFHSRRRYVRDDREWERLTSIVDPDNEEEPPAEGVEDKRPRVLRVVTVETEGSDYNRRGKIWSLTFGVKVGYGFTDERPENRGNSFDELMKAVHALLQEWLEVSALGFSEGDDVEVDRARMVGTRFVTADAQGRPAHVADLQLFVTVEVC
jgi:hypothetical protein